MIVQGFKLLEPYGSPYKDIAGQGGPVQPFVFMEGQQQFGLLPLEAQERQHKAYDMGRLLCADIPAEAKGSIAVTMAFAVDAATKGSSQKFGYCRLVLADADALGIAWCLAIPNHPHMVGVPTNAQVAIGIQDASGIGQGFSIHICSIPHGRGMSQCD